MTNEILIAHNAVIAKVQNPSTDLKLTIQKILSFERKDTRPGYKDYSNFNGTSSLFNYDAGTFSAGLVWLVKEKLERQFSNVTVRLIRKPLPEPLGDPNMIVDDFGNDDERYEYQPRTVNLLLENGMMIAQVATGGGKSRIARMAFKRINRPTLFLTTRGALMYQMKDSFERDLKVKCTVLGDGEFGAMDKNGNLTITMMNVGMVQTLSARLEKTSIENEFQKIYDALQRKFTKAVNDLRAQCVKSGQSSAVTTRELNKLIEQQNEYIEQHSVEMGAKAKANFEKKDKMRNITIKLLSKFECVILEEAHEVSGDSYFNILNHCPNAHYRLALTATPFMKEQEEDNLRLMAVAGSIGITVDEHTLIERGILAKPYFKYCELSKRPTYLASSSPYTTAYRMGIVENDERNQLAIDEICKAKEYGLNAMILVQHTKHGDKIYQKCIEANLRVAYIQGEDSQDKRQYELNRLGKKEIDVLIGTNILDVGVDVPSVGMIVLLGGGKAQVALRQRVGRGLRAKKNMPNCAFIVDFNDKWNKHTRDHYAQRHAIIKGTKGFGENIVDDFDFKGLGFKALD